MSKRIEFQSPKPEFVISPTVFSALHEAIRQTSRNWVRFDVLREDGQAIRELPGGDDIMKAFRPIFSMGQSHLGSEFTGCLIDCRPVMPGTSQRGGQLGTWHIDRSKGLVMSDSLPTKSAVGSIPKESRLAELYRTRLNVPFIGEDMRQTFDGLVREAVEAGDLKEVHTRRYVAHSIGDKCIHGSLVNEAEQVVDRCFVSMWVADQDMPAY